MCSPFSPFNPYALEEARRDTREHNFLWDSLLLFIQLFLVAHGSARYAVTYLTQH